MDAYEGKSGGTWLAMNSSGKIGSLLNVMQPLDEISDMKLSRGSLVVKYLETQQEGSTYLRDLRKKAEDYDSFLLLTFDISLLNQDVKTNFYTNAHDVTPTVLKPGVHAFGNCSPYFPWRKVTESKKVFQEIVQKHSKIKRKEKLVDELMELLMDDTEHYPDMQLAKDAEGRSEECLRKLSAICVRVEDEWFGSRSHSVILVDGLGNVDFIEKTLEVEQYQDCPLEEIPWSTSSAKFVIQDPRTLISHL